MSVQPKIFVRFRETLIHHCHIIVGYCPVFVEIQSLQRGRPCCVRTVDILAGSVPPFPSQPRRRMYRFQQGVERQDVILDRYTLIVVSHVGFGLFFVHSSSSIYSVLTP